MPESVEQCLADWDRYHRVANPKESKSDTKKVPISLITHTMNTSQEKFLGKLLTPEQNEEFDRIGRLLSSGIEGLALSEEFKTEFLRKAKNAFIGTGKKKVSLFDVIVKTFSQKEEDEKLTPADYSEFIEEVMSSHTPIDVIDATLAISTPVFAVYGAKVLEMVKTDIGAEEFDAAIASVVSKETLEDFKKEIIDGYGTAPGEKEREKVEALMNDGYGDEVAYAIYSVIIGSGSTKK